MISAKELHLLWIYNGPLATTLHAGTWLSVVSELRRSGWRVTLVSVGPRRCHDIRGVEVFCIPRPEIYILRQAIYHLRVLQLAVRHWKDIDMILFHEGSAPWVLPLKAMRWLTGQRTPVFVMDTRSLPMPPKNQLTWKDKIQKRVYLIGSRLGNRSADGRLAITKRMAEAADIPRQKLWGTWTSGVDLEHFVAARSSRKWPSQGGLIRLLYHGSLDRERNLLALSRAVASANATGTRFELSLVGEGTGQAELQSVALQTNGAVRVFHAVPYDRVPELLAQAHVGVLPFPDEEKFRVSSPLKLFEYMAAGLPVLATRIACHTDVLGEHDVGFWAESGSEENLKRTLCLLWHRRESLSQMGSRAAFAAETWTWKRAAERLRTALETGYEGVVKRQESRSA